MSDKKFYAVINGEPRKCSHNDTAGQGWDDPDLGYSILDQLDVGDKTGDQDGDTWERVA